MPGPVLLVHDDISAIAGVRRLLLREGLEVVLATSVADAIIALGHYLPSLMLIAPSVEGDRGAVLLEELRHHPDSALVRVVLLGEAVPGVSAPVVPLPLDGATFMEVLRGVLHDGGDSETWKVIPTGPVLAAPAVSTALPDEWKVATAPLEEALFGDLHAELESSPVAPSPFLEAELRPDEMERMAQSPAPPALAPPVVAPLDLQPAPDPLPREPEPSAQPSSGAASGPDSLVPPEPELERFAPPGSPPVEEPLAAPALERFAEPSSVPVPADEAFAEPAPRSLDPLPTPPEAFRFTPAPRVLAHLARWAPLPSSGRLSAEHLVGLLVAISDLPRLTSLTVSSPAGQRVLWLEGERIHAVSSAVPQESLLDQARRDGLIDERQEAQLQPLRFAPALGVVTALSERGLLRQSEIPPLLERYSDAVATAALLEPDAPFELRAEEGLPRDTVAVPRPLAPVLADVFRRWPSVDIEGMRAHGNARMVPAAAWEMREHFRPTERERRLLAGARTERRLGEILEEAGHSPEWAARAARWALQLGVIGLEGDASAAASDPTTVAARLAAKWNQVQEADYFAVLGLSRRAGRQDVQHAFEQLVNEYGPAHFGAHPDVGVRLRAERLGEALREAAHVLSDDQLRAAYARNLLD